MRPSYTFICLLAFAVATFAQAAAQVERLRSPEISTDGHVTFRLAAPEATAIAVRNTTGGYADWPGGNLVPMTKDSKGSWSATIGPLKPEYYTYVFVVDGVTALDPQNVLTMRDGFRYSNSLRIAGALTANYDVNNVRTAK